MIAAVLGALFSATPPPSVDLALLSAPSVDFALLSATPSPSVDLALLPAAPSPSVDRALLTAAPSPSVDLALLPAAPSPSVDLALLPTAGDPALAQQADGILGRALSALEGVHVLEIQSSAKLLGPEASAALQGCTEDACFRAATRAIRADGLIVPRLERESGLVFRLRLVDTSTRGRVVATRVARDVPDAAHLEAVVVALVADLLPERARSGTGLLVVRGAPLDARVEVDGHARWAASRALAPEPAIRLSPGEHDVRVSLPRHTPSTSRVTIRLGQTTTLDVTLAKNRSRGPWVLGGIGVATSGLGLLFGGLAARTAHDWEDACASGRCASGFTRARYEADRSNVDRERFSANALFVVSAVAVVAGVAWYALDPGEDLDGFDPGGPEGVLAR